MSFEGVIQGVLVGLAVAASSYAGYVVVQATYLMGR